MTSPVTSSAAEIFTLAMKGLPYVNLIGENTNGILSDELTHVLPNGARIVLSNEVYSDPEGAVFEAVGMGPEKEENKVPFLSTLDFDNKIDSGIERAIELLGN
ncbi:S41 family peptidase [Aquimarina sp. I32.4]|uniref:S41 family peptidase n=1 Tax=Aquimarina sp. I32.4 TaxID=2053903 RepID=UPI0013047D12|nr:S41 family peptidase [Aquimarina sp. I32.4]